MLGSDAKGQTDITLPEPAAKPLTEKKKKIKSPDDLKEQALIGYSFTLNRELWEKRSSEKRRTAQTLRLIPAGVMKKLKEYTGTELSAFDHAVLSCVIQLAKNGRSHIVPKRIFSLLCGDKNADPARAERSSIISSIEKLRGTRVYFRDGEGKVIFTASLLPLERSAGEDGSFKTGSYRYKVPGIVSILSDTFCSWLTENGSIGLDVLDLLILRAAAAIHDTEIQRREKEFDHPKMTSNDFVFKSKAAENQYIYLMLPLTVRELPIYIEKALNGEELSVRRDTEADDNGTKRNHTEVVRQRLEKMVGKRINCSEQLKRIKDAKAAEIALLSVDKANDELQFSYEKDHLLHYLGKQTDTLDIDLDLLYPADKTGRDIVGKRCDELLLKIMLAARLTQTIESGKSEGKLFFRKQPNDLYGLAASLKKAAFVPKRASADRGRRGKEISELRNKRFDQLCNKLRRVAEYYQRINIAESFEPICQKTDNKKQQS